MDRKYTLLGILIIFTIVSGMTITFWNYTQDDVYITMVYSRNLAEGMGFVFNVGERVQGTTTPLWTLVLTSTYWFNSDLLVSANFLSAISLLVACAIGGHLLVKEYRRFEIAIAYSLLLVSSPFVYVSYGMETLFYIAILMSGFWLWASGHFVLAMIMAGLLTWTRADGALLGVVFGLLTLWEWFKRRVEIRDVVLRATSYVLTITPWFIFAWIYFGTPLPQTFSAKARLLEGLVFLDGAVETGFSFYANNPIAWFIPFIAVIGAWRALQTRTLRAISLWTAIYLLSYTLLNVWTFWYFTPLLAGLCFLTAIGGQWLLSYIPSYRIRVAFATILLVVVVTPGIIRSMDFASPPERVDTYRIAGQWIENHTATDASLTVGDLGIVGYYARRNTIDTFGLIVPDKLYFSEPYTVMKWKTDYILMTQHFFWQNVVDTIWRELHYHPLVSFYREQDHFSPMTLYRRTMPIDIPDIILQGFSLPLSCKIHLPQGQQLPITTTARLVRSDGTIARDAEQNFLWWTYPDQSPVADDWVIEQISIPLWGTPPGYYIWELECGDEMRSGNIEILPISQSSDYISIDSIQWADLVTLRGFIMPEGNTTWSGGSLLVALDLEVINKSDVDYNIFIHVIDQDNNVVAQSDGYPRDYTVTTSTWQPNETVIDIRRIELPHNLPSAEYMVEVGWYNAQTGERLLVNNEQSAFRLPLILINHSTSDLFILDDK